jgi:hypothetical protein
VVVGRDYEFQMTSLSIRRVNSFGLLLLILIQIDSICIQYFESFSAMDAFQPNDICPRGLKPTEKKIRAKTAIS